MTKQSDNEPDHFCADVYAAVRMDHTNPFYSLHYLPTLMDILDGYDSADPEIAQAWELSDAYMMATRLTSH